VIGERPTGPALVDALRAAAAKAGRPLYVFVQPLVTSNSSNFLAQLGRADRPLQITVDRVRALIAGEPIPPPRPSNFKGCYGRHERSHSGEAAMSAAELERRKLLTHTAHAKRLAGETVAAAVKRLGES
jgi:hypothetical protein